CPDGKLRQGNRRRTAERVGNVLKDVRTVVLYPLLQLDTDLDCMRTGHIRHCRALVAVVGRSVVLILGARAVSEPGVLIPDADRIVWNVRSGSRIAGVVAD